MKYFLIAIIAFVLWLTAPLWMNRNASVSLEKPEHTASTFARQNEADSHMSEEEKAYAKKFGLAPTLDLTTHIPTLIQRHWRQTAKDPDSYKIMKCTKPLATDQGWRTTCMISLNTNSGLQLQEKTYYIDKGKVRE